EKNCRTGNCGKKKSRYRDKKIRGYLNEMLRQSQAKKVSEEIRSVSDTIVKKFEWAGDTKAKIAVLSVINDISEMEINHQSFLSSGGEKFLEQYQNKSKLFQNDITKLREIVADAYNRESVAGYAANLEQQTDAWKNQFQGIIASKDTDKSSDQIPDRCEILKNFISVRQIFEHNEIAEMKTAFFQRRIRDRLKTAEFASGNHAGNGKCHIEFHYLP
ncbi:MAG: hypothetical protein HC887_08815, partial [Desulfobacteraceae bacterium]|nr:hypothetical protein [Desulfobacteraceae bacterium]